MGAAGWFILRTPLLSIECLSRITDGVKMTNSQSEFPEMTRLLRAIDLSAPDLKTRWPQGNGASSPSVISKLLRRASRRTTPFGLFSAESCGVIGNETSLSSIREPSLYVWRKPMLRPAVSQCLQRNPTLYFNEVAGEYRYYRQLPEAEAGGVPYEMVAIQQDEDVATVFKLAARPISEDDLYTAIGQDSGDNEGLVRELIDAGAIVRREQLHKLVFSQDDLARDDVDEGDFGLSRNFGAQVPTLDARISAELIDALEAIVRQWPIGDPVCARVERRFLKRYGRDASVSLLEALDPEVGIWFAERSPLAALIGGQQLEARIVSSVGESASCVPVQSGDIADVTEEDELDLSTAPLASTRSVLRHAPILTVSASLVEQGCSSRIWLRGVEASPGYSLLVRHAMALGHTTHLSSLFDESDPEVIFAELVHAPTSKSESIATRLSVTPYEIELFYRGSANAGASIRCDELELRASSGRMFLWCERLGKKVVPVLSVPLNTEHASLPIFRFLSVFQKYNQYTYGVPDDIGETAIRPGHGKVLEVNNGTWAKRIVHRRVVIRCMRWRLKVREYDHNADALSWAAELRQLTGIPQMVCVVDGGARVDLDLADVADCTYLRTISRRIVPLEIEESFVFATAGTVSFPSGHYIHELLLPLRTRGESFEATSIEPEMEARPQEGWKLIDDGFAIILYCPCHLSNQELIRAGTVIERYKDQGLLRGWFFNRFADDFPFLRLSIWGPACNREQQSSHTDIELMRDIKAACTATWKITFDTLHWNDIEYGGAPARKSAINLQYYHSHAVLTLLRQQRSQLDLLRLAARLAPIILLQFGLSEKSLSSELKSLHHWAVTRFSDCGPVLDMLSRLWRLEEVRASDIPSEGCEYLETSAAATKQLVTYLDPADLQNVAGRFVHMFLNRIFHEDHLVMEAATYDICLRRIRRAESSAGI